MRRNRTGWARVRTNGLADPSTQGGWTRGVLRRALLTGAILTTALPVAAHAQYRGDLSTIVLDDRTGQVLQQNEAGIQRFPASLTKLMTLYMVFQALRDRRITLDEAVPVSEHAASMEPSKLGLLPGTYITVEEAVLALVTKSANDAASALGEMLGGDEGRFGQMMTLQARALGMRDTTFRNASGLPNPEQVTTASDLALLARHLIGDFPEDYHYFSVPEFWFHGRLIPNHDPMLRSYPGADGLKTGFTDAAGCNLVTSAVRGNVRLVGVVLGASNNVQRSAVMTALLNQGFAGEGVPVPVPAPDLSPFRRPRHREPVLVADMVPAGEDLVAKSANVDTTTVWRHHHLVRRVMATGFSRARHGFRMDSAGTRPDRHVHAVAVLHRVGHHHVRHVMASAGRHHAALTDDAELGQPHRDFV